MLMHKLSLMSEENDDEKDLYGRQVAVTLWRFTNCQNAIAKLGIQGVLIDVKFPHEEQHCMPQMYGYGQCH